MKTETPEPTAPAPGAPQEAQNPILDPMDEARHLLAGIEADIQGAQTDLARTLHEGHEHFRPGMEKATAGLQDADLDSWTHQAAAMARIQSATAGVKAPNPSTTKEI